METEKKRKNDVYAVALGGALVLLVGAYFIGKSMTGDDAASSEMDEASQKAAREDAFYEAIKTSPFIEADDLTQKIKNGDKVQFVDIRSPEEYAVEHIKDSRQLVAGAFDNLSINQGEIAVIVFSEDDIASFETAKNVFDRKSFPYFFLRGGLAAWKVAGNPTISIGDPRSFVDQSKIIYISPEDLALLLDVDQESVFLIDVQSKEDFRKGHIKGAMNLPLDELEDRISKVRTPVGKTVVVYGKTDVASFQAGVRISDLGAMAVRTLSGNDHLTAGSGLPIDRE
jgi:rhodanese-related sulfurtransferase